MNALQMITGTSEPTTGSLENLVTRFLASPPTSSDYVSPTMVTCRGDGFRVILEKHGEDFILHAWLDTPGNTHDLKVRESAGRLSATYANYQGASSWAAARLRKPGDAMLRRLTARAAAARTWSDVRAYALGVLHAAGLRLPVTATSEPQDRGTACLAAFRSAIGPQYRVDEVQRGGRGVRASIVHAGLMQGGLEVMLVYPDGREPAFSVYASGRSSDALLYQENPNSPGLSKFLAGTHLAGFLADLGEAWVHDRTKVRETRLGLEFPTGCRVPAVVERLPR